MKVQVINKSSNPLPQYETPQSAGMDLKADLWSIQEKFLFGSAIIRNMDNTIAWIVINPGGRALIPTELYTAIPAGYEVQVRPRSGLALKHGITVLNTPMTLFILPAGGFFVFGILIALANKISGKKKLPKAELHGCESCPLAATCSKVVSEREDKEI